MIHPDATRTIGGTPLVELARLASGLPGRLLAKLDMRNPCGSVKDRLGLALVEDAERSGLLKPGMTIVEPTGGNTGIGLAQVAAVRGYRLILVMPENMSRERVALLRFMGAQVEFTPGMLMGPAVERARRMVAEAPEHVMFEQFANPANPTLHETVTGPEIWDDCGGEVDVFVSAVGTGGTITGVGRALRTRNRGVRLVAVEPSGAAVLSGRKPDTHSMPGIGVGFIPAVLDRQLLDEVVAVDDEAAFEACARLARIEGILAGVSSGAALWAALGIAKRPQSEGGRLSSSWPIPPSATLLRACSTRHCAKRFNRATAGPALVGLAGQQPSARGRGSKEDQEGEERGAQRFAHGAARCEPMLAIFLEGDDSRRQASKGGEEGADCEPQAERADN